MPRVNRRPELRDEIFPETRGGPPIHKEYKNQRVRKCTSPALGKIVRRVGRDQLAAASLAGAGAIAVVVLGWCCVSGFLVCMYLGSKQHQKRKIVFALEKETPTSRINRAISPKAPKKLK